MPTIYAANESAVLVNGEAVQGVQALEYRRVGVRTNVYGVGSAERIGVVSGPQSVEGRITVASGSALLDSLTGDEYFQVAAQLRQGDTQVTVSFDECLMTEKAFSLSTGGHGQGVYAFTATRVREEP